MAEILPYWNGMKSNHPFFAFVVLTVLTGSFPVWASDKICQRHEVLDPAVRGRAFYIEFPDGRFITVVGHNHGHRPIQPIIDLLNRKYLFQTPNEEFAALIKDIISETSKSEDEAFRAAGFSLTGASPINHAHQDLDLIYRLGGHQNFQFMGTEATPKTSDDIIGDYVATRRALLNEYYRRARAGHLSVTAQEVETALLGAMNAPFYAYANTPDLARHLPAVGMEDPEVHARIGDSDHFSAVEEIWKEILKVDASLSEKEIEAIRGNPALASFSQRLVEIFNAAYAMNTDKLENFAEESRDLIRLAPPKFKPYVENLMAALARRMQNGQARDAAVARNLARQRRSGVHFAGLNHLRNTVRNLQILCRQELNRQVPLREPKDMRGRALR